MTGPAPLLTIAIATRNRAELLAQVLDSCASQRVDDALIEVLVVLDGADDQSRAVFDKFDFQLRKLGRRIPIRLVEPWAQSRGLATTRNVCADEATGRWIRFQDDDDVMDPYASAAMIAAHLRYGRHTAILGFTGVAPHIYELPLMHYLFSDGYEMFCYQLAAENERLGFQWFWGGRTSVDTDVVRAVRFDEGLDEAQRFASEDVEFAFRASLERGLSVVYTRAVRGYMIRALDLNAFVTRRHRQGLSARYVATKHAGTELELWALNSHMYSHWDGDVCSVMSQAMKRCRRLEIEMDIGQQGLGRIDSVRQPLYSAYRETFGLASAIGFLGVSLPHD